MMAGVDAVQHRGPTCPTATRLLDLPEFEVHLVDHVPGETHVVMSRPRGRQACTRCGLIDDHTVHDRVIHRVRDLPSGGRQVVLVWHKRVLACAGGCGTFRERSREIVPRACWTTRAGGEAVRQVAADNRPVAAVAGSFGVAWDTVMRTVHASSSQDAVGSCRGRGW